MRHGRAGLKQNTVDGPQLKTSVSRTVEIHPFAPIRRAISLKNRFCQFLRLITGIFFHGLHLLQPCLNCPQEGTSRTQRPTGLIPTVSLVL